MNKVVIFTDSTCDLPSDIIKEFDIQVLPLIVNFDGVSYKDGRDIVLDQLFNLMANSKLISSTSAISPIDFTEAFKPYIDNGYDIFYTGIGSHLSGTIQSAYIASQEFEKGRIIIHDSKNLSTGIGIQLLQAVKLRDLGYSASDILVELVKEVDKVRTYFGISTLENLFKGGRASGLQFFFGKFLRIKPVLAVRDGKLFSYAKVVGKLKAAVDKQIEDFLTEYDNNNVNTDYLFITSASCNDMVEYVKEKLKERDVKINKIIESNTGCVIGSHCGPGTLGLIYTLKD
jgi:DegV family protein with EDD domain